ncbi:MAG: DNA-processing protein DprA [Roseburia sp.]|nr:DNA-processing protein DprA [Roseburia sp.]
MAKDDLKKQEYALWACSIKGIGIRKLMALEREFQTPERIFLAKREELEKVDGICSRDIHNIMESKRNFDPEPFFRQLKQEKMACALYFSKEYPKRCRQIYDPPRKLFYMGRMPEEKICIAVVGARSCSHYGRETARKFASRLASAGVGIVSGMARGIDGWAHQGALEGGGRTYAVLGNSAEICYPAEHEKLYRSILKNGGVLSEYPPGTEAAPHRFPERNRIISALSDGVLIVEARIKSGSLITADQALSQGRDVFVIPGRAGDALSEGCNNLIKQGANLVTSPEEIIEYYGIVEERKKENFRNIDIFLERREKMVYASLSLEPKHFNVLTRELDMKSVEVMDAVLTLRKHGLIKEIGNHYYIKNVS